MKSYGNVVKMLDKINRRMAFDHFLHNKEYFFDNGQTVDMIDILKADMKYTIIKLQVDVRKSNFVVFVMIQYNEKVFTHQLFRFFDNERASNIYIKNLEIFIKNSTNDKIVSRCYSQLPSFFSIMLHKEVRIWEHF